MSEATGVVAIVAAFNRADTVGATVQGLRSVRGVSEVVVVDDGSVDDTGDRAAAAGARVVTLEANRGKGGALEAGIAAAPDADVYLLADADLGASAAGVAPLLDAVTRDEADLAVGVLPATGGGGLGWVRRLAAAGIARASGLKPRAPLSGQRAVRGELLRSLELADRFGVETAMTIDAARAGARIVEIDVDLSHRATGRSLAGFRHRAGQGLDILRELWPRLTSSRQRVALLVLAFVVLTSLLWWSSSRDDPATTALAPTSRKVVLTGVPGLDWEDLASGGVPNIRRLADNGTVGAMSVRTASKVPSTLEAYAALGAGTRVRAVGEAAIPPRDLGALRRQSDDLHLTSEVGALGSALAQAGRRGVVVPAVTGQRSPAEMALMDRRGIVHVATLGFALDHDDVVLVDTSGLDLAAADDVVGRVVAEVGPDALVLVFSPTPPATEWRLAPVVAAGGGVQGGTLFSPSTRRRGLVTITDLAPTVLSAVGVPVPSGMIGHALRVDERPVSVAALQRLDRDAAYRESTYLPVTIWYIVIQAVVYLLAIVAFTRFGGPGRASGVLRWTVLAIAAHPLGTFVLRAIPGAPRLGWGGVGVLVAIDLLIAAAAQRARRHPLAPLQVILGATIALLVADVGTGARLQLSSILGYSPHTAARFRGLGNTAFATLAASTVLFGAIHVRFARRRREALVAVALLFSLVVIVDGAPTLGSDVGGILTLVPVFAVVLVALAGRRVTWRIVLAALVLGALAVGGATAVDLAREPGERTHLGRLVGDVETEGRSRLVTTIERKVSTNFRTLSSPWTWAVGVITVYVLFVLWTQRGSRLFPSGSALRIGGIGALGAGMLGYVTNDSGIVVTALVFVYLGPYLTLIAMGPRAPA